MNLVSRVTFVGSDGQAEQPLFDGPLDEALGSAVFAIDAAASDLPREIHRRPDYIIEPPDILEVAVHADGADDALVQQACGERLVSPDGKIDLGEAFGTCGMSGVRLDEAPERILDLIRAELPNAEVEVSVFAQNSKVYYVIIQCGKGGDLAARYPYVGDDTVKDALANLRAQMPELNLEEKQAWVARPCQGGAGTDTIFPIDLSESCDGGSMADCPLQPGDRVFVADEPDAWHVVGNVVSAAWRAISELPVDADQPPLEAFERQ